MASKRWGQTAGRPAISRPWGQPSARIDRRRVTPIAALLLLAAGTADSTPQRSISIAFDPPLRQHELLREWTRQTHRKQERGASTEQGAQRHLAIVSDHGGYRPQSLSAPLAARRKRYAPLIQREAARHGIDPELVHAVIRAESGYDTRARSPAGACGLMQLMPATAARFGVADRWDPAQNIRGGVAYLRFLLERFDHDLRLALAAYNAGEGAVEQYGRRIPPYPETQTYVRRVLGYLGAV